MASSHHRHPKYSLHVHGHVIAYFPHYSYNCKWLNVNLCQETSLKTNYMYEMYIKGEDRDRHYKTLKKTNEHELR